MNKEFQERVQTVKRTIEEALARGDSKVVDEWIPEYKMLVFLSFCCQAQHWPALESLSIRNT